MLKSIAFLPVLFLASQCFAWTFNVDSIRVRGGQQIDSGLTVGKNISCDSLFRNNDTSFAALCSLYDGATYRDRVEAKFLIQGDLLMINISSMTGTITSSTLTTIVNNNDILQPSGGTPYVPCMINNNGTKEIGTLKPQDGYLVIRTGADGYLDAGTGGIHHVQIIYRVY